MLTFRGSTRGSGFWASAWSGNVPGFSGNSRGSARGRSQDEPPGLGEQAGAAVVDLEGEPVPGAPLHLERLVVPFRDQFVLAGDGQPLAVPAGVPERRGSALAVAA